MTQDVMGSVIQSGLHLTPNPLTPGSAFASLFIGYALLQYHYLDPPTENTTILHRWLSDKDRNLDGGRCS